MSRFNARSRGLLHVGLLVVLLLSATLLPGSAGADPATPPVPRTDVIQADDPNAPTHAAAEQALEADPNVALEGVDPAALDGTTATERDQSDPTAWWWYYSQTPAQVTQRLSNNGARLVDIEVQQVSPLLFTVAMVKNSGAYNKGWWWYYGITAAQVTSYINANTGRLIDIEPYIVNGAHRFAIIMVPNTGGEAKGWWWYYGLTAAGVNDRVAQNNGRLVDIDTYMVGSSRRYSVIMISNTGADASGWWYYYNVPPGFVANALASNNARLVDLEQHSAASNTFTVIMVACPCNYWWWYYGITASQVNTLTAQNGARIVDIETYLVNGSRRFAVAMINNSNAATTRVGHMLRTGTNGATGLYLKRVNGAVQAGLQESRVFEPASTIKVVPHLYALRQVQAGNIGISTPIARYPYGPNSCPGSATSGTDALSTALREMMRNSDNARTRGVVDRFGRTNINAMAHTIGMASTNIFHVLGCGGPTPNQLTLADAGRLYEGVEAGQLLNTTNRSRFYTLMAGKAYDFTGIWADVRQIVDEEAPAGMTEAEKTNSENRFQTWYKAGGYTLCTSGGCATVKEYRSVAGTARIPACGRSGIVTLQYVYGIFIDGATNTANANNTFNATKAELLREPIRSALRNWAVCG